MLKTSKAIFHDFSNQMVTLLQPSDLLLVAVFQLQTYLNPLHANPTKWSNTPKQFVGCCR